MQSWGPLTMIQFSYKTVKLHDKWGHRLRLQSLEKASRLLPWLSSFDVAGTRGIYLGCHHIALLRLAAKLSHVGMMWMG
jgi:hypothetical protein